MLVFTDKRDQPDIGSMGAVAKALDLRPQLPLPPVPRLEPLAAPQVLSTSLIPAFWHALLMPIVVNGATQSAQQRCRVLYGAQLPWQHCHALNLHCGDVYFLNICPLMRAGTAMRPGILRNC